MQNKFIPSFKSPPKSLLIPASTPKSHVNITKSDADETRDMLQLDKLSAFLITSGLGMGQISSFQKGQIGKKKGDMCSD